MSDTEHDPTTELTPVSDSTARFVRPVGPRTPVVGHSPHTLLDLIRAGVNLVADLDHEQTRMVPSRSVDPERGLVETLVLVFQGGETWFVEVERERL